MKWFLDAHAIELGRPPEVKVRNRIRFFSFFLSLSLSHLSPSRPFLLSSLFVALTFSCFLQVAANLFRLLNYQNKNFLLAGLICGGTLSDLQIKQARETETERERVTRVIYLAQSCARRRSCARPFCVVHQPRRLSRPPKILHRWCVLCSSAMCDYVRVSMCALPRGKSRLHSL